MVGTFCAQKDMKSKMQIEIFKLEYFRKSNFKGAFSKERERERETFEQQEMQNSKSFD